MNEIDRLWREIGERQSRIFYLQMQQSILSGEAQQLASTKDAKEGRETLAALTKLCRSPV